LTIGYFTINCKSNVRVAPVADATTVTVYVPCGVAAAEGVGVGVGDDPAVLLTAPPPQPAISRARKSKGAPAKISRVLLREFLANKTHPPSNALDRTSHVPDINETGFLFPLLVKLLKLLAAAGAVVLMKTLSLPPSMLRSIDLGRKPHCVPAGSPLQLNDKTPGRPEIVRAINSYLANPPAGTVMELGVPPETEREKSTGLLTITPTD